MNPFTTAILAAIVGASVGVIGTFWFQKKLLKQQLDASAQSQKQLHDFIQSLHGTFLGTIKELENRLARIADRLPGGQAYASFHQADQNRGKNENTESKSK